MTAQKYANNEGVTYIRIAAGTVIRSGILCPLSYCVRAIEARFWELLVGQIVFPTYGEHYRQGFSLKDYEMEPFDMDYDY